MAKKKYTSEEIIHKLREADVLLGQGHSIAQACKQIGVTDQTYYRWRKAYGGLKIDQASVEQVWLQRTALRNDSIAPRLPSTAGIASCVPASR